MDIRVKRTKQSIINAFIELRAHKPLEKITVKELCEKAQINKSTFYTYYEDLFHLSDQLEGEVIASIVANVAHPEYICQQPKLFARDMFYAYLSQVSLLEILFSGDRKERLICRLSEALKEVVFTIYPEYQDHVIVNIILSYAILGGYHAIVENRQVEETKLLEIVGALGERSAELLKEYMN